MIDSITRITLNLQETNTMESIRTKRGDTSRKLLIHLSDGSIPYHISDECYATFTAKKADGTKINNPCTIENNVIIYEFTEQTCAAVGTMKSEIRLYGADDKMITSACFLINVYDTVFREGDEVSSEGEMNTLDALICEANELIQDVQQKLENGDFIGETGPAGADGTVAFENLTEEQRESLRGPQGEVGNSGVWVGHEAPTDKSYTVWVDPTGDASDGSGGNANVVEPVEDDIPKVFFGSSLPQTKTDTIMPFRYISKTKDISGYCKTKAQGNSSMGYPKKNQSVKLYEDAECSKKLKVDFKGWGEQNKFCFKANWIDLTHARNVVSARLWADVVKTRANYTEIPELLRTSPNQGAVDGFPVKVYAGGVYQGRYTINIPKDAWMANMDAELDNHCILCGENYASGCFRAEANINGADWTDEIHDTVPTSIKSRWNEIINFVMDSTDEEFRANLDNYIDIQSLIDYHLFGLVSCGLDAYGKNQLYMTYDGQKWYATMYDMDSTWGLWWTGQEFVEAYYDRSEYQDFKDGQGNLLYIRLEQNFEEELRARWEELKNGALSIENIINRFERFTDNIPTELVEEDYASTTGGGAFTSIPSKTTNNIQQIRSFALNRLAWMDGDFSELVYSLAEPTTFNGGSKIDTGIMLFDTNKDFTIIVDFQSDENIDTYPGNRSIVHSCYEESPWPGFNLAKHANGGVLFGSTVFVDASEGLNRQLVVITKDAENAEIKARTATKEATITGSNATTTFEQTAVIGAVKTLVGTYSSYWKGTVYRCDIYLRKFTDDEVNEVLGV